MTSKMPLVIFACANVRVMRVEAPKTVDEYLASISPDSARASLERLRTIIMDEIPEAEEVIAYGIPTYKFLGTMVSIAGFKNHCSFFPGHTLRDFSDQLAEFKTSRGTVQYKPDHPIPEPIVRAMLRARYEEYRDGSAPSIE